jgi:hypothetical protein
MALSATYPLAPADDRRGTRNAVVLVWATAVFALAVASGINSLSTDDAMRLVEVRDLLAGQSWFDMTQYRLDPPAGLVSHWSRLIDLPLAVLIKAGSLFLSPAVAEKFVLVLWPTLLLLIFLAGVARVAQKISGPGAVRAALLFAVLMPPVLQDFRTGAIHHHNVQLVLLIWSLAFFVRAPSDARPAAAAGAAGLLCALSVAVGQQMVPAVAMLCGIAALRWIIEGERCSRATAAFATALAAGAIVFAAATVAPAEYLVVHCDAISFFQVSCLLIGGLGLAALASLARIKSTAVRALCAGTLAALLFAFVKLDAPQCLGGPYGQLDPRLANLWLASVAEARNVSAMLRDVPQQVPAYYGVPLAALVLAGIRLVQTQRQERWNWAACAAVQAAMLLVSAWEVRGASGANAVGAALLPAALSSILPATPGASSYFGLSRAALSAMLLFNPATLSALGGASARVFAGNAVSSWRFINGGDAGTCQRPADYKPLARLPRGLVLAFIDSGPFILMETSDAILAAPYHRNQAGNLAMLNIFMAMPAEAQARMADRGVNYVAFCPGAPERYNYTMRAPESLVAALSRNEAPGFLEKVPLAGTDLVVYRVRN